MRPKKSCAITKRSWMRCMPRFITLSQSKVQARSQKLQNHSICRPAWLKQRFVRSLQLRWQLPKDSSSTHAWHRNWQSAPRCSMKAPSIGRPVNSLPLDRYCLKVIQYVSPDKMFAAELSLIATRLSSIRTPVEIGSHYADSSTMTIISSSLTHCSRNMQRWDLNTATPSNAKMLLFFGRRSSVISPTVRNLSSMNSFLALSRNGVSVHQSFCSCHTVMKAKGQITPLLVSNAIWRSVPKRT